MKRVGNLYNQITTHENIRKAYYKARMGKLYKKDVLIFNMNLDRNLFLLQTELIENKVSLGNYHFFTIYDPKERIICAADFRERILHHAIMNVLDLLFEKYQIFDSYACRKNKGTEKAVKRALFFTRKYQYFIKMDIRKYFDSINHVILKKLLRRKIKDKAMLNLLDSIILSYEKSPGCGIPIGNLTSQYFANYYLGFTDRYIKEKLKVKGYVRYMDDMVIWGNNQEILKKQKDDIIKYIKYKLQLEVKLPYSNICIQGVPFLGYLVKPYGIYLQQKSKRRFIRRYLSYLEKYNHNLWDEAEFAEHCRAIIAWTLIAKAKKFRYTVFNRYVLGHEPCETRRQLEQ
jgi:RNA-directed DNA polymerase